MFLRLAAATGARRGELCGLRWKSVDFAGRALLISRGVVLGPGGEVVEKDTKTHAARRIALDAATVELLASHRERWRQRLALCEMPWSEECYVFSYDAGARVPIAPERLTKRFRHLADRLDLEHVRLHDLRHDVATRLIAGGVPVRTVSGRLGHAATSTTVNTYTHFVQATDQEAALLLGRLLDGPPDELGAN
jgi:integrase